MAESGYGSYTAKLTDGPLEGKTVRTSFTEGGEPQARLEIPAGTEKRYLYTRGTALEFDPEGENPERPSAVDYRFLQAVVVG